MVKNESEADICIFCMKQSKRSEYTVLCSRGDEGKIEQKIGGIRNTMRGRDEERVSVMTPSWSSGEGSNRKLDEEYEEAYFKFFKLLLIEKLKCNTRESLSKKTNKPALGIEK